MRGILIEIEGSTDEFCGECEYLDQTRGGAAYAYRCDIFDTSVVWNDPGPDELIRCRSCKEAGKKLDELNPVKSEVAKLMELPWENEYRLTVIDEADGGGFQGMVKCFSVGCRSHGETPEEAITNLRNVLEGVLETYVERGWKIPTPGTSEEKGS